MRIRLLGTALFLYGCTAAPTLPDDFRDAFDTVAPGELTAGCSDDLAVIDWSVTSHPLVDHYEAVVLADGTEVQVVNVGAEGTGRTPLEPAAAQACASSCVVQLFPVDGEGQRGDLLVQVQLSLDEDSDGFTGSACGGTDCDDADATIHPEAAEQCDGIDHDCSGDPNDVSDPPAADLTDGVCAGAAKVCDGQNGWVEPDYTAIVGFEADEASCDGLDNDCNGVADDLVDAPAADLQDGVCAGASKICDGQGGWLEPDYSQYSADYATVDTCDGLDNDCNGAVDDVDPTSAPAADLQDGVCAGALKVCGGQSGWVEPDYTTVSPDFGAEDCDGLDNDCNGADDDALTPPPGDRATGVCATAIKVCGGTNGWLEPDYTVFPGFEAEEVSCDGSDNDCNGVTDDLIDAPPADLQDGVCEGSRKVCDGQGGWAEPDYSQFSADYGAEDCDQLDNDCNGIDDDVAPAAVPPADLQDGVCAGALKVCGTTGWEEPDYTTIPLYSGTELCDSMDNDCNGTADDFQPEDIPLPTLHLGVCAGLQPTCDGTAWVDPDYSQLPDYDDGDELRCDGLDNNCDGVQDNVVASVSPPADMQLGVCADTVKTCDDGNWVEPDYALQRPDYSTTERCDDLDNDCDGTVDDFEPADIPLANLQHGVCLGAEKVCDPQIGWLEPDYSLYDPLYELVEETCDTFDNDCDGVTDTVFAVDPDSTVLECWGEPQSPLMVQLDAGPWSQVSSPNLYWDYPGTTGCALDTAGQASCWGYGEIGMLGDGTLTTRRAIAPVEGGHSFSDIEVGASLVYAVDATDGSLWMWGTDHNSNVFSSPVQFDTESWRHATQNYDYSCGIKTDGTLWCWGSGDLGIPGVFSTPIPLQVGTASDYERVELGLSHACAFDTNGVIACWGSNYNGECAVVGSNYVETPTVVEPPAGQAWVDMDVGMQHTCALTDAQEMWCWGNNFDYPLANPTLGWSDVPVLAGTGYTHLWLNESQTCGGRPTGEVDCWGYRNDVSSNIQTPEPVEGLTLPADAMEMGLSTHCGIDPDDGSLWCLGRADDPLTGETVLAPRQVTDLPITELAVGLQHVCYRDDADAVWCFGNGNGGALGDGNGADSPTPVLAGNGPFSRVVAGDGYSMALDADGNRWGWGIDSNEQQGDGLTSSGYLVPTLIEATKYAQLWGGYRQVCGLDFADTAWCWGGSMYSRYPYQIGPEVWASIHPGQNLTCAIDDLGDLFCWGVRNNRGQLGTGDYLDHSYATRVAVAGGPWRDVGGYSSSVCALAQDDTVWCWGSNIYGVLGPNGVGLLDSPDPIQIPGTYSSLSVGFNHACAVSTDGGLWCWGNNEYGQLGLDPSTPASSDPVNVIPSGVQKVSTAYSATCASRADLATFECP